MFAAVPVAEPEVGWEGGGVGLLGVALWKYPHESWARTETENRVRGAQSGGGEDASCESLCVRVRNDIKSRCSTKVGES